jgi:hypothetical protein
MMDEERRPADKGLRIVFKNGREELLMNFTS